MKIGLIQTFSIGDIIIALPIATYLCNQGHEVFWPIDADYLASFRSITVSLPRLTFLEVVRPDLSTEEQQHNYYYHVPHALLLKAGCERIIPLYNAVPKKLLHLVNKALGNTLKFDQYKYAMAGVPFAEKWNFKPDRNMEREKKLYDSLNITKPYICLHTEGSTVNVNVNLSENGQSQYQIIKITPLTDSVFDWIYTLEHASKLVLLDSCFANLVEQLNLTIEKYFILRSLMPYTPVLKNDWHFIYPPSSSASVQTPTSAVMVN